MSNAPNPYSNPYAPPQAPVGGPQSPGWGSSGTSLGRLDGKAVVVPNGAMFPPLCLKCASQAGVSGRNVNYSYVPPWARLFGPLIQVFVMKKSKFSLPLCTPCNATWKKWNHISWLSCLPGLALLAVGAAMDDGSALVVAGLVVTFVTLITVLILRKRHVVVATKIDKTHTWLAGLHDDAVRASIGG